MTGLLLYMLAQANYYVKKDEFDLISNCIDPLIFGQNGVKI